MMMETSVTSENTETLTLPQQLTRVAQRRDRLAVRTIDAGQDLKYAGEMIGTNLTSDLDRLDRFLARARTALAELEQASAELHLVVPEYRELSDRVAVGER